MERRFLFVFKSASYSGSGSQELLDQAMTVAAFDQPLDILLMDDGVFHLLAQQSPAKAGFRDIGKAFMALDMLDIPQPYVEVESLRERGISVSDLCMTVREIKRSEVNKMLAKYSGVLSR